MNLEALAAAADDNLGAAWALLGHHAGFALARFDNVSIASAGVPMAFFNGAFASGPCADPSGVVADVISFYAGRNVPFLLWARPPDGDGLLAAGRAAGLRDAGGPPLMVLPVIDEIPLPPMELDVRIVNDPAGLQGHRRVVAGGFGMPPELAQVILGDGLLDDPDAAIAVGCLDGEPVATALLARTGDTAGVYNVATLDAFRGKGYGAAVTWAAVAEGARRGCTHAALQSSDAGYRVYARMGFIDLGRYVQLEGPPHE